jgi:hypothetical protein
MLVDEYLQYQVMYKGYVEYFELNDILMDVFGCGFMMLIVWIFGSESKGIKNTFWKTPEYVFLSLAVLLITTSVLTCFLALYDTTQCNNTWFPLSQLKNPGSFWQVHPIHGSVYHVMQPVEGLAAILIACLFFASIDILKTKANATT